MLNLAVPTDPAWLARVLPVLDEVLLEQAHLEKKAASAALRFMFRYQEHAIIQEPLSALAREELEHFELVLRHLDRRGVPFRPQEASPYASELQQVVRGREPERLLDSFLVSAVIEARSCERMQLLAEGLVDVDPELAAMYRDLVACEARHHGIYLQLGKDIFGGDAVRARLQEIAAFEGELQERLRRDALARFHT